jgi:hypothetical protein
VVTGVPACVKWHVANICSSMGLAAAAVWVVHVKWALLMENGWGARANSVCGCIEAGRMPAVLAQPSFT